MEDSISLATYMQIGGKDSLSLAAKIHNKLRYTARLDTYRQSPN